ncbi:unnamed protein product [Acanthoscelides obtectus]|uniref:Uncharacterized protein n=1 Tax=Acanthoscelides obtectus TaxID=200917 RepID=A0A9P0KLY1_ACAOB|nr:unnamed protein product [Acanthoscelides obtectus]CAK1685803.1 hypothetical protein AOBTE_LOCUS35627 [Acanthoscelides obtectus]
MVRTMPIGHVLQKKKCNSPNMAKQMQVQGHLIEISTTKSQIFTIFSGPRAHRRDGYTSFKHTDI